MTDKKEFTATDLFKEYLAENHGLAEAILTNIWSICGIPPEIQKKMLIITTPESDKVEELNQ